METFNIGIFTVVDLSHIGCVCVVEWYFRGVDRCHRATRDTEWRSTLLK